MKILRTFAVTPMIALLAIACSQKKAETTAKLTKAPFDTTFAQAKMAAADGDKPIVIDFYTDWCTWCKKLDTEVYTDPKTIDFFTNKMVLFKTNAEVDTALAHKFNISGYPTLVMTDSKGNEIDRIIGYEPTETFLQHLQDYQNGIGTLGDLLKQADTSKNRDLYFQIADKYKYRGGDEDAINWYNKVIDAGKPTDSMSGESKFAIADMYFRAKKYDEALSDYGKISKDFKGTGFAELADIYTPIAYTKMGDTTKAISAFEKFIKVHPNSEDTAYAKIQIGKLKGTAPQSD
jgi:thioredoxin-related protein